MKKRLGNLFKFIFFLGTGVLLIWLVTKDLTPAQEQEIKSAFRNTRYWLILPTLVLGIASHWARALRWRLLMQPIGYQPSVFNTFCAVMIGYMANLAIPRLGEITRCGVLSRYEKIPADKLIGTMIAERAVDLLCLAILLALTVLLQLNLVGMFFYQGILLPLQKKFMHLHTGRGLWILIISGMACLLVYFVLKRFSRSDLAVRLRLLIRGVGEGIVSIGRLQNKWLFMTYSLLIWGLYFAMVWMGFLAMAETSRLGIKAGLSVLGFGSIGMIVTQGGIGAYPLLVQKTLLLYDIHPTTGYAFGWVLWLAQTLLILFIGFVSILLMPLFNKLHHGKTKHSAT